MYDLFGRVGNGRDSRSARKSCPKRRREAAFSPDCDPRLRAAASLKRAVRRRATGKLEAGGLRFRTAASLKALCHHVRSSRYLWCSVASHIEASSRGSNPRAERRIMFPYPTPTTSISRSPAGLTQVTTSPTAAPSTACASGEIQLTLPCSGSASSSPTI